MRKELLIFGSNGALGSGASNVLLNKDYDKVYLFDFQPKDKKSNSETVSIKVDDLSNEENVEKAFSKIKPSKETGFFLFSTVGGFAGGKKIWETALDELSIMMKMNFTISFLIAKHFARIVKESHSGSICFTSAFVGDEAEPGKSAYGASKGALIHLTKTLAKEGNEIRLSANTIAPYIIDTPANREWLKDADFSSWTKPEEIGELVHSIFNNYNYLTGNLFKIKGRFSLD